MVQMLFPWSARSEKSEKSAFSLFTGLASMEWKEEHDLLLCREILVCQPYKFKERTVERGKIWEEISNHLNTCETAKFRVNKRSV